MLLEIKEDSNLLKKPSKPICENIILGDASSWRYWLYEVESLDFHWHYHPEYEICLTLNSNGDRYIGDNIQPYGEKDLVLVGPSLPHAWRSDDSIKGSPQQVYVAQIPTIWIERLINRTPEMQPIKKLLDQSFRGIAFSPKVAIACETIFLKMRQANSYTKLVLLLEMLWLMYSDQELKLLSSDHFNANKKSDTSSDKIDKVIHVIQQNYTEPLIAEDMASLAHMSTNHFHRVFKNRTEQTFTELVNQLRIGKACSMLTKTLLPISQISDVCGFNNTSNFNRRFLRYKNCTPSHYRKAYIKN